MAEHADTRAERPAVCVSRGPVVSAQWRAELEPQFSVVRVSQRAAVVVAE